VRVSGAAEQAAPVDDVSFRRDAIAFAHVRHERADACDVARELVPDGERRTAPILRPLVPVVDVHVGAADTGATHANQYFIVADLWDRDVAHGETRTCSGFDERSHAMNSGVNCNVWCDDTRNL
jgi:hypothetical protein